MMKCFCIFIQKKLSIFTVFCAVICGARGPLNAIEVLYDEESELFTQQKQLIKNYIDTLLHKQGSSFDSIKKDLKSWEDVSKNSKDAVVQIFSYVYAPNILEPYRSPEQGRSSGTGFFIDDEGHLLTNFHVVDKAVALYIQIPSLGKEPFELEYIGGNPQKDIAFLKLKDTALARVKNQLPGGKITYLSLGDSDMLAEAQEIMIVGYPLGQENLKVSLGIASGRESTHVGECIQTTAAMNFGNSGGPVLDRMGNVIGVCVLKQLGHGVEGMAYLIPINNVKNMLKELSSSKIVKNPYWGCALIPTTEHTLNCLGNPIDGGVYVAEVKKGSLAEVHGIFKGDVIFAINGIALDHFGFLNAPWSNDKVSGYDFISRLATGSQVTISLYRKGEKKDVIVEIKSPQVFKIDYYYPWYEDALQYEVIGGMVVTTLTMNHLDIFKEAAEYLDISFMMKYEQEGNRFEPRVILTSILPTSNLHKAKCFNGGDRIIKMVNDMSVHTIDDFKAAVTAAAGKKYLTIETEGGSFVALSIEEMVQEEDLLAQRFGYSKSPLIAILQKQLSKGQ